jgi:methionyl-tRNA synthetase
VPYGGDGDFTWERFEEKYNADLANNLGNLVNRVAAMTERYRGGQLKAQSGGPLATVAAESVLAYRHAMDRLALHEGVASAYRLISAANEFIAETQPWSLAKDPASADRLSHVLYDVAESVRIAAVLLLPVMPSSAAEILRRLGETAAPADLRLDTSSTWRASGERAVVNAGALWPRLEDKGAPTVSENTPATPVAPAAAAAAPASATPATQAGEAAATAAAPVSPAPAAAPAVAPAPVAGPELISIDDFMKVQLKVAKILEAERVPKSKKLVQLKVDVGEPAPRTILAGIAESYEPEQLVGRTIVVVANLKPAKLMGIESNGMVLAASPDGGGAMLLNAEPATPGTRVR